MDIGHNSEAIAADRLRSFVARIEKLEQERQAIGADIREVYAEAKGTGFDVKTIRQVIRERKLEPADRAEQLSLFELYWKALEE